MEKHILLYIEDICIRHRFKLREFYFLMGWWINIEIGKQLSMKIIQTLHQLAAKINGRLEDLNMRTSDLLFSTTLCLLCQPNILLLKTESEKTRIHVRTLSLTIQKGTELQPFLKNFNRLTSSALQEEDTGLRIVVEEHLISSQFKETEMFISKVFHC